MHQESTARDKSNRPKLSRRVLVRSIASVTLIALTGYASGWFVPNETKITELAPGVYFRKAQTEPTFTGCNQGWVIFKDFVLVIDANFPGQVEEVVKEIRKTTDKPIRYVFDTHYHGDHADGNQKFYDIGAVAVASENSKSQFETKGIAGFRQAQQTRADEYGGLEYRSPSLYFPQRMVLDDGEQRVELLHFGHGHTPGDAFAWLPKHGILFTGDACVNGPFNYAGDGDTASWIKILTEAEKLPVKQVAPGHGELADKKLLEKQKRYFAELRQIVQSAIDAGKSLDQIKASIELPWYKEWTGVDVKTRGENIDHVYAELTGEKNRRD